MTKPSLFLGGVVLAGAGLSGCAVYVPTIPSTPLVEQGQVEVTTGLRSINSLEAGAAWAPTAHLLLNGELAYKGSQSSTTSNNTTTNYNDYNWQGNVGIGVYRAPTESSRFYLAAVGGVGFATVSLHSIDFTAGSVFFPFPLPYISGHYEANYWRYYGQIYAAHPLGRRLTGGLSVRGTYVSYSQFRLDANAIAPTNNFFIEPTFFLRIGHGTVQGQATVGLSVPAQSTEAVPWNKQTAPVSSLVGASVVLRTDRLFHRR